MSKFFYKGRPDIMGKHNQGTYKPQPNIKPGSEASPIELNVQTDERKSEIEQILASHQLFANIAVNPDIAENIDQLTTILNKPTTQVFAKTPQRNEPCSCGSGKKFKKCCG